MPESDAPDVLYPTGPRYPSIQVQLTGRDGNVFAILGRVTEAMKRAGVPRAEMETFLAEARSGDYDHALQTCMRWVDVR